MKTSWMRGWAKAVACVVIVFAGIGAAHAAAMRAYLSAGSEPFDEYSNVAAMTAAFGSDWDRLQYGDAYTSYSMLYIDGGSQTAGDMVSFLDSNRSALEAYVLAGGRLFINAATEDHSLIDLVFGAQLQEQTIDNRSFSGRAVDGSSALFNGAGTGWDGVFFAHDTVVMAAGYESLIVDELGRTVLAGGFFGSGYVMVGGQTNTFLHDGSLFSSDPFQLRVNELLYADSVMPPPPPPPGGDVPEPSTLALAALAAGLLLRRKRSA